MLDTSLPIFSFHPLYKETNKLLEKVLIDTFYENLLNKKEMADHFQLA